MSYLRDISNSEFAAKDIALKNRMAGVRNDSFLGVTLTTTLATTLPSVFLAVTQKIASNADGKGGDDKSVDTNKNTLKEYNKKVDKLLKEIGAKDERDINEAVSRAQDEWDSNVNIAQRVVDNFANKTDDYSTQINDLKSQKAALTTETDPDGSKAAKIDKQIAKLESEREKVETLAKNKLEEAKAARTKNINEITSKANEAIGYLEKIAELKSADNEDTVSVPEKTESLADCTKLRNVLIDTKSTSAEKKTAAQKLKKLAEENPDNATMAKAYKVLQPKLKELLK